MKLIIGDCIEEMKKFDADSIDAIVTDPPYGLEFMGKSWNKLDGWRDGGGTSKPGIGERKTQWVSFGGETANPSCRNCGGRARGKKKCSCTEPDWHVDGEDFDPVKRAVSRSQSIQEWHYRWTVEAFRVAKPGAHLVTFGGTRTFHRLTCALENAGWEIRDCLMWLYGTGFPKSHNVSKKIDKAAGMERDANEAKQWDGWGTALKPAWEPIILARKPLIGTVVKNVLEHGTGALNINGTRIGKAGRWPANVILDEKAGKLLDKENGSSRFFYCAKASRSERGEENNHPTVKPIALMCWLCKLITPPNGTILDPFLGSGSTGMAATLENFEFIGIDKEEEYVNIAQARIDDCVNSNASKFFE